MAGPNSWEDHTSSHYEHHEAMACADPHGVWPRVRWARSLDVVCGQSKQERGHSSGANNTTLGNRSGQPGHLTMTGPAGLLTQPILHPSLSIICHNKAPETRNRLEHVGKWGRTLAMATGARPT